jgi:hypothetical protein
VGVVVGTYAAVAYVHLHLEAHRRYFPGTPLLVHDDHSPARGRLLELTEQYGASFAAMPMQAKNGRFGHAVGDLSVFASGLSWAAHTGCDLLLKVSRRFVPITDVVSDLAALAGRNTAPVYGVQFKNYPNAVQTACVGLDVAMWTQGGGLSGLLATMSSAMDEPQQIVFVEAIIYSGAASLDRSTEAGVMDRRPRPYVEWDFAATPGQAGQERYLCHRSSRPADFAALAHRWSLPYSIEDFAKREF